MEHAAAELDAQSCRAHPRRLAAARLRGNAPALGDAGPRRRQRAVQKLDAGPQAQVQVRLAVADQNAGPRGRLEAPQIQLPRTIDRGLHDAALDAAHVFGVAVETRNEELRAGLNNGSTKEGGHRSSRKPGDSGPRRTRTRDFKRTTDAPEVRATGLGARERAGRRSC